MSKTTLIQREFQNGNFNIALIASHLGINTASVFKHVQKVPELADLYNHHQRNKNAWRREINEAIERELKAHPRMTSAQIAMDINCTHARVKRIRRELNIADPQPLRSASKSKYFPAGFMWYGVGK